MLQETTDGVILSVKLTPKSSKSEIIGIENNELKIRVATVPEKGAANEALIKFLSKKIGVGTSQIEIISGEQSRHKRLLIKGIDINCIQKILILPNKI